MRLAGTLPLRLLIHAAALLPLAILIWDLSQGQLTADPIREIQDRTGRTALAFLTFSLACRPLADFFGFKELTVLRRPLGLYAFSYACLHLFNFVAVDYGLNFGLIRSDALVEKPFIVAGITAFVLLSPLAIASVCKLKGSLEKRDVNIGYLVYPAVVVAVVHFVWATKADIREPLIYGLIVAVLLALRLPVFGNTIIASGKRKR